MAEVIPQLDEQVDPGPRDAVGHFLFAWSQLSALGGAVLLFGACALSVYSVVGRWLFDAPVLGDVEMVQMACALAIAAAPADTDLTVTLRVTGQTVEVELLSVSSTGTPIRTNTFAWTVLTALVDTVDTRVSEDGLLSIRLRAHGIESVAS